MECGKKSTHPDSCLEVLQLLLDNSSEEDDAKQNTIFISIGELFLKYKEVPEKWKKLVSI